MIRIMSVRIIYCRDHQFSAFGEIAEGVTTDLVSGYEKNCTNNHLQVSFHGPQCRSENCFSTGKITSICCVIVGSVVLSLSIKYQSPSLSEAIHR